MGRGGRSTGPTFENRKDLMDSLRRHNLEALTDDTSAHRVPRVEPRAVAVALARRRMARDAALTLPDALRDVWRADPALRRACAAPGGSNPPHASATDQALALAREEQKTDTTLDFAKSLEVVFRKDPDLYRRYQREATAGNDRLALATKITIEPVK